MMNMYLASIYDNDWIPVGIFTTEKKAISFMEEHYMEYVLKEDFDFQQFTLDSTEVRKVSDDN